MIQFLGEYIDPFRLIRHYRHMARIDPLHAGFWRMRCRAVIHATREQLA